MFGLRSSIRSRAARRGGAAACLALLPLCASCVSSQTHQRALEEKDRTITHLRDERAQLKSDNLALRTQNDELESRARTASERPELQAQASPAAAERPSYPELDEAGVGYGQRNGNMVLTLPDAITFSSGKADLTSAGQKALRKVAATLQREYPGARYSIEGHTDADPIKKSQFSTNRELSVARAMAVLRFLVEECAVPDEHCVVAGHGQYDPVATGTKDADKA
jgi:chemotaxis protein MotB